MRKKLTYAERFFVRQEEARKELHRMCPGLQKQLDVIKKRLFPIAKGV